MQRLAKLVVAAMVRSEVGKWSDVVKKSGANVD